jgi:hypothetical protein
VLRSTDVLKLIVRRPEHPASHLVCTKKRKPNGVWQVLVRDADDGESTDTTGVVNQAAAHGTPHGAEHGDGQSDGGHQRGSPSDNMLSGGRGEPPSEKMLDGEELYNCAERSEPMRALWPVAGCVCGCV